jgi:hypothetical protein
MICTPLHILLGDEIKEDEMDGHVASVVGSNMAGNASISLQ